MVDQDQNPDLSPVRPRFLTILCYLTIFASTYMIFSAFSGLSDPESTVKAMNNSMDSWESVLQDAVKNDPSGQTKVDELIGDIAASNTSSNMRDNSFFSLISNLLTMIGAFLMLRLKKWTPPVRAWLHYCRSCAFVGFWFRQYHGIFPGTHVRTVRGTVHFTLCIENEIHGVKGKGFSNCIKSLFVLLKALPLQPIFPAKLKMN